MNKIKRNIFIIFIFIISIGVETAHMSNIYIPRDHPTIQEGINAGENGDHIIVSDGIYTGEGNKNLTFHGKSITVRSEMGADNCIIDCQGNGRGFFFDQGETSASILKEVTIKNGFVNGGFPEGYGGAILCRSASPSIVGCRFMLNHANSGGAIAFEQSISHMSACTFVGNSAQFGGAMTIFGANPVITSCKITGNIALNGAGAYVWDYSNPEFNNVLFEANVASGDGGGIDVQIWSNLILKHSTLVENSAAIGGALCLHIFCSVEVCDSIFYENDPECKQIALVTEGVDAFIEMNIQHSLIENGEEGCFVGENAILNWGEGMIGGDPLFAEGSQGNYYLDPVLFGGSPAIDSGSMNSSDACYQSGFGIFCLDQMTTDPTELLDSGYVDIGYHYFAEISPFTPIPTATMTYSPTPTPIPSSVPNEFAISGTVRFSENGGPMPGSVIEINDSGCTETANNQGYYEFQHLAPGSYKLTVITEPPLGWRWQQRTRYVSLSWSDVTGVDFWTEMIVWTPTPVVTPSPTMTQIPPTGTERPTVTVKPTPIFPCIWSEVFISMPAEKFKPGDKCWCRVYVDNCDIDFSGYPLVVVLNVGEECFFAPNFGKEFDHCIYDYPEGRTRIDVIDEFTWPEGVGSGRAIWFATFTNRDFEELFSGIDQFLFEWSD